MYEVINYFTDLQDNEYPYNVGDKFPREGLKVSEDRIKELSGSENRQEKPLIRAIEYEELPFSDSDIEFETRQQKNYTRTDINKLSTAELKELAFSNGIENALEMTGVELKKILIQHFGL